MSIKYQITRETKYGYDWLFDNLVVLGNIDDLEISAKKERIPYERDGNNFFLFSTWGRSDIIGQLVLLDNHTKKFPSS